MKKKALLLLLTSVLTLFVNAQEITLPALYSDGMVLQQNSTQTIRGKAAAKSKVTATWQGKKYSATADKQGDFALQLPTGVAGGPYELTVGKRVIKDVLVGDVFLCSGQSNMELPMYRCEDLYRSITESYTNPLIHYIKIVRVPLFDGPASDLPAAEWQTVCPEKNPNIGAVCFFFAKTYQEQHNVPVGIINSSVGGSPVEAWISEDSLMRYAKHYNQLQLCKNADWRRSSAEFEKQSNDNWNNLAEKYWQEFNRKYPMTQSASNSPQSAWRTVSLFSPDWATDGESPINGLHAFRKTINLTAQQASQDALLRMGCIVDADEIFVNGERVGVTYYQYPPRKYKVKASLLKEGENIIDIHLKSYGGIPCFVPEKPYKLICGNGTEVSLQDGWMYQLVARMPAQLGFPTFHYMPASLYNGMIAPLLDWQFSGAVWYQGESNVGKAMEYEQLLTTMIHDWRNRLQRADLPFVIIQLANFLHPQSPEQAAQTALREAQRRVAEKTPHAGLVVTSDLGEWNDIHPLRKQEVGERVAEAMGKVKNEK